MDTVERKRYEDLFDLYTLMGKERDDAITRVEAAERRVAELEAANEWRPVTEKPEQDGDYLVCTYFGRCEIMLWSDGSWYSDSGNDGSVSHWRPLPPPPQGE